jgi:hypothetical protein
MSIVGDNTYIDKYIYRCKETNCRTKMNLLKGKYIELPRKPINDKLLASYEYLAGDYERRVLNDCSMSKGIYQKVKKSILKYFEKKFIR